MKNWNIGTRIMAGFIAVIVITAVLGSYAFIQLQGIKQKAAVITEQSMPGMATINDIESQTREHYTLTLRHVIADTLEQKTAIEQKSQAVSTKNNELCKKYEAGITSAKDRELLSELESARADYRKTYAAIIA